MVGSDAKVYKLVGPVLLKQDVEDAKTNVSKRLDFIAKEAEKVATKLERKSAEVEESRKKIIEMQTAMQQSAVQAANADPVTQRFKLTRKFGHTGVFLKIGLAVSVDVMRQVDRLLHRQVPIHKSNHRLCHKANDAAAAR